jgi:ParB family chromosome partitioning protein
MAADDAGRSRLGRGLAALMGDVGAEADTSTDRSRSPRRVPIEFITPNPRNPRRHFAETELDELAASIGERGLIQPIVVREARGASDRYEIIAGERRWRASQRAGLHDVPIVIIEANDSEALQLAIIENVQRADLNPIEEGNGYLALVNDHNYSQEQVAEIVGKSRPHVANMLRLTKLPETVKRLVVSGKLSAGHARVLIGQPNAVELAEEIIARGLNVRQAEALTRPESDPTAPRAKGQGKAPQKPMKDSDTIALERRLSDALGLAVTVDHRGEGGTLHIAYRDVDQLEDVVRKLERGK